MKYKRSVNLISWWHPILVIVIVLLMLLLLTTGCKPALRATPIDPKTAVASGLLPKLRIHKEEWVGAAFIIIKNGQPSSGTVYFFESANYEMTDQRYTLFQHIIKEHIEDTPIGHYQELHLELWAITNGNTLNFEVRKPIVKKKLMKGGQWE